METPTLQTYEIRHRITGAVLYTGQAGTLKAAVQSAVNGDANLGGANLGGANLGGANLRDADLGDADLGDADLGGANLRGADLGGANLRDANLGGANLRDADLRGANLRDANLRGADLGGANLGGANLGDADLRGANLRKIRDDLWAVLSSSPKEVPALREAIIAGKIDGSAYEGECACLVGTIANACKTNYANLPILKPDSVRPAEIWFLNIRKGDTPSTNQCSKIALEWVETWMANMREAFAVSA